MPEKVPKVPDTHMVLFVDSVIDVNEVVTLKFYQQSQCESHKGTPFCTQVSHADDLGLSNQVFFPGGTGGSPSGKNFVNPPPPIRHLSQFLDQGLSPQPRFFPENLKNLNTFLCQIWLLFSSKEPLKAVFHT